LDVRGSLRGIYLVMYAAELVSRLIEEHDPHPNLFDRLETSLARIGTFRRDRSFWRSNSTSSAKPGIWLR